MDVQRQSIELMSERMRKAMELPARFAECRNPADLAKFQAEFASTMVSDYFEAARKMLTVLTDATQRNSHRSRPGRSSSRCASSSRDPPPIRAATEVTASARAAQESLPA